MKTRLYYDIEIRDKNGKLLSREKRKAHSFVQAWNMIVSIQAGCTAFSITDTGGTPRTVSQYATNLQMLAAAASVDRGIFVGRGSTAVAITDTKLETICGEGTGTNNLNYQATTVSQGAVSGSSCSFTVSRAAINNSGNSITVTEIGIYVYGTVTKYTFLAVRDVLASSQGVPNGGAITVVYTIKATV